MFLFFRSVLSAVISRSHFYSYHPLYNSFILYLAFLCSYIHPRSFFHMTFITPHDVPVTTLTSSTFPSFSNFLWGTHSFLSLHTSIHLSFASPLTLLSTVPLVAQHYDSSNDLLIHLSLKLNGIWFCEHCYKLLIVVTTIYLWCPY